MRGLLGWYRDGTVVSGNTCMYRNVPKFSDRKV